MHAASLGKDRITNGVYVKLKADNPYFLFIRCVCHSLQLAFSHTAVITSLVRKLDFLIRETDNWYLHSSV